MKTATLMTKSGEKFERPLVCEFSHVIDDVSFVFVVTKDEDVVPGTVFSDPHRYTISHADSGAKVATCRHSNPAGVLGAAQTAIENLKARHGARRVRLVIESAKKLSED